ncbi:MAG: hypothetical protein IJW70_10515 [Clostridia bacterium]|nr:hypothetical protein [Clostridia bacterium]
MKKRIAVALLCLALVGAMTACNLADFEFGGLVGELLGSGELIEPGILPPDVTPPPDVWGEDVTMGPGEQLYGFPDALELKGDIVICESEDTLLLSDATSPEMLNEAVVGLETQFAELYGHSVYHKIMPTELALELALSETMAGTGMPVLCYLPLSAAGEVAVSGTFHSNQSLSDFELDNGCWFDGLNADLQLADGTQYSFAGFLTPYTQLDVDCMVYSDRKMQELGVNMPATVYDGLWTLDTFLSLSEQNKIDLNGDGQFGEDDFYGALFDTDTYKELIFDNSGIRIFEQTEIQTDALQLCTDLFHQLTELEEMTCRSEVAEQLFYKERALFYATRLSHYAGLDGYSAMMTNSEFPVCVVPMPVYSKGAEHVATSRNGAVLSIARSGQGDLGMTLNVLAVLAANHMMPAVEACVYRVNPTEDSARMSYYVMERAHCDLMRTVLRAQGYACDPMEKDPVSFFEANRAKLEKAIKKLYDATQKNHAN